MASGFFFLVTCFPSFADPDVPLSAGVNGVRLLLGLCSAVALSFGLSLTRMPLCFGSCLPSVAFPPGKKKLPYDV